jgi:hypothetical protein
MQTRAIIFSKLDGSVEAFPFPMVLKESTSIFETYHILDFFDLAEVDSIRVFRSCPMSLLCMFLTSKGWTQVFPALASQVDRSSWIAADFFADRALRALWRMPIRKFSLSGDVVFNVQNDPIYCSVHTLFGGLALVSCLTAKYYKKVDGNLRRSSLKEIQDFLCEIVYEFYKGRTKLTEDEKKMRTMAMKKEYRNLRYSMANPGSTMCGPIPHGLDSDIQALLVERRIRPILFPYEAVMDSLITDDGSYTATSFLGCDAATHRRTVERILCLKFANYEKMQTGYIHYHNPSSLEGAYSSLPAARKFLELGRLSVCVPAEFGDFSEKSSVLGVHFTDIGDSIVNLVEQVTSYNGYSMIVESGVSSIGAYQRSGNFNNLLSIGMKSSTFKKGENPFELEENEEGESRSRFIPFVLDTDLFRNFYGRGSDEDNFSRRHKSGLISKDLRVVRRDSVLKVVCSNLESAGGRVNFGDARALNKAGYMRELDFEFTKCVEKMRAARKPKIFKKSFGRDREEVLREVISEYESGNLEAMKDLVKDL